MEISADTVPFLARRAALAGVEHLLDCSKIRLACARAGETDRGRLQRLAKFGQLFQFAEIDRSDDPVAAIAPDQLLAFQPYQRRPDRGAGAGKPALQPTLGLPCAVSKVERQDHFAQPVVA